MRTKKKPLGWATQGAKSGKEYVKQAFKYIIWPTCQPLVPIKSLFLQRYADLLLVLGQFLEEVGCG